MGFAITKRFIGLVISAVDAYGDLLVIATVSRGWAVSVDCHCGLLGRVGEQVSPANG